MRRHQKKNSQKGLAVLSGKYIKDFTIAIKFTDGDTRLVDFLPLFQKYVKGENLKYFAPQNFKKFIIKNNNIYWGRNEDVIFPARLLLNPENFYAGTEEVLYVI